MGLRIARAELAVATARLDAVAAFYAHTLGFAAEQRDGRIVVPVGADVLELVATGDDTDPFHHFALLVPGDRFDAARAWLGARTETLARDDGETVFPFDFWDARAVYFHDPAGNIVELIAHHGLGEAPAGGAPFGPDELLEVSEVGLVNDDGPALARALAGVGVVVWDGSPEDGLAFAGERARTVIIAPRGRGWLPTGRPAEMHRVAVTVRGLPAAEVSVPGTPHRVTTIP